MGRSRTPLYVVRYTTTGGLITPVCWNGRTDGRATAANLKRHVDAMAESFLPGGANHTSCSALRITGGRLLRNDGSREEIATYTMTTPTGSKDYESPKDWTDDGHRGRGEWTDDGYRSR